MKIKLTILTVVFLTFTGVAYAAPTDFYIQGLRGNGTKCLKILDSGLVQVAAADCGSGGGGGSGGGTWATTTSTVANRLINYSLNNTDIVTIGNTATTTGKMWFDPNTLFSFFSGSVGINSKSTASALTVAGNTGITANIYTATSTVIASTFPYASTTMVSATTASTSALYLATGSTLLKSVNGLVSAATLGTDYLAAVTATSPLSGSGTAGSPLVIANSAADGSTKGAASFTAADFDASSGNISIDYTNGQKATAAVPGFLTSADWSKFDNKVSSTSLSGASVISYTSSSGVITTTGGTFGAGTYTFPTTVIATTASTTNLVVSSAGGGGTSCLQVANNGTVSATGSACGSGGGAAYPFQGTGNSTSTLTQFNAGLTAYASSTIGSGANGGGLTVFGTASTTATTTLAVLGGNVGIGTNNPTANAAWTPGKTLNIVDTVTSLPNLRIQSAAQDFTFAADGSNAYFYLSTSGGLRFYTAGNEKMKLSAAGGLSFGNGYVGTDAGVGNVIIQGNLGVGVTSPGTKLEVSGTASTTGLVISNVGATGTKCLQVANNGSVTAATAACSSGGSSLISASSTDANYAYLNAGIYLQAPALQATSTTATSTFAGGVTIGTGPSVTICPNCINNWGLGTSTPFSLLALQGNYNDNFAILFAIASSTRTATTTGLVFTGGNLELGIGTTTPYGSISIEENQPTRPLINIASTTGSARNVIFQIDQRGHKFASSTAPTLSSGVIDGTDQGGRVLGCSSACTITFNQAYLRTPSCMVVGETMSLVNALSYTPTAATLVVTQTGLGTFDFICSGQ